MDLVYGLIGAAVLLIVALFITNTEIERNEDSNI